MSLFQHHLLFWFPLEYLFISINVAGIVSFRKAVTTVYPLKPDMTLSLVTTGIYKITRNPMYLGSLLLLIGWAFFQIYFRVWLL
jgi:protein-S-isoprenylcysteine O-methyltransferase Ste14